MKSVECRVSSVGLAAAILLATFCLQPSAFCQTPLTADGLATFTGTNVATAGSGGGSCPPDGSPSAVQDGSTTFLKINSDAPFVGQYFTNTSSFHLCKVRVRLTAAAGISGVNFTVRVYALSSGAIDPASPIAESSAVAGNNSWVLNDVMFTFSSPPLLSANTPYAIVITGNGGSGAAQYLFTYKNTAATINGHLAAWLPSGSQFNPGDGSCWVCALYWY